MCVRGAQVGGDYEAGKMFMTFNSWRRLHRTATGTVAAIALLHSFVTFLIYEVGSTDALWFFGTGLGLFLLAVMNWAHVGLAPCEQPTARPVRYANIVYGLFALIATYMISEPQAIVLAIALVIQAIAGFFTLRGPTHS